MLTRNPSLDPEFNIRIQDDHLQKFEYYTIHHTLEYDEHKELWLNVLHRSLLDYTSYNIHTEEFKDAFNWFFNENRSTIGSFKWICEELNLHTHTILKTLINFTKKNLEI